MTYEKLWQGHQAPADPIRQRFDDGCADDGQIKNVPPLPRMSHMLLSTILSAMLRECRSYACHARRQRRRASRGGGNGRSTIEVVVVKFRGYKATSLTKHPCSSSKVGDGSFLQEPFVLPCLARVEPMLSSTCQLVIQGHVNVPQG